MKARRRLEREIVRRRRRDPWPVLFTRIVTPNGVKVRVELNPRHQLHGWGDKRATYTVPYAHVYGPWPPPPDMICELGHWA